MRVSTEVGKTDEGVLGNRQAGGRAVVDHTARIRILDFRVRGRIKRAENIVHDIDASGVVRPVPGRVRVGDGDGPADLPVAIGTTVVRDRDAVIEGRASADLLDQRLVDLLLNGPVEGTVVGRVRVLRDDQFRHGWRICRLHLERVELALRRTRRTDLADRQGIHAARVVGVVERCDSDNQLACPGL